MNKRTKRKKIILSHWNTSSGNKIKAMTQEHFTRCFKEKSYKENKHANDMVKFAQDIMV